MLCLNDERDEDRHQLRLSTDRLSFTPTRARRFAPIGARVRRTSGPVTPERAPRSAGTGAGRRRAAGLPPRALARETWTRAARSSARHAGVVVVHPRTAILGTPGAAAPALSVDVVNDPAVGTGSARVVGRIRTAFDGTSCEIGLPVDASAYAWRLTLTL